MAEKTRAGRKAYGTGRLRFDPRLRGLIDEDADPVWEASCRLSASVIPGSSARFTGTVGLLRRVGFTFAARVPAATPSPEFSAARAEIDAFAARLGREAYAEIAAMLWRMQRLRRSMLHHQRGPEDSDVGRLVRREIHLLDAAMGDLLEEHGQRRDGDVIQRMQASAVHRDVDVRVDRTFAIGDRVRPAAGTSGCGILPAVYRIGRNSVDVRSAYNGSYGGRPDVRRLCLLRLAVYNIYEPAQQAIRIAEANEDYGFGMPPGVRENPGSDTPPGFVRTPPVRETLAAATGVTPTVFL